MKAKPLSLHPLKFKEAVKDLLNIKPETKPEAKRKVRKPKAK